MIVIALVIALGLAYMFYYRRSKFASITVKENGDEVNETIARLVESRGITQADVDAVMKFI
jgi:hypothetical protein